MIALLQIAQDPVVGGTLLLAAGCLLAGAIVGALLALAARGARR